jgi:hypothetical protein
VGRVDPLQTKDPIINYRLEIEIPDHSVINPDSTRATFYLKIARPSEQPLPGHFFARWGLASSRELEGQHATEVQFVTNTMLSDSGIRRSPRTEAPDEPNHEAIEPDTYHELWYLMDRSRGTFDLYIRGGSLQEQTLLSKDVPMIDEADTPLDIFSLFCSVLSSGGPLYLDDLYIDSHSHNLGDPDSKWMLIDDFEDGDIGEWVVRRHTGMSDEDFALAFEVASVLKEGGDVNAAERIHDEILRRVDRWNIHSVEHLRTVVRVHALRGNKDEVLKYLRIMSELGARDSDLAGKPEFSSLANNVEFRQIMEEFETRRLSAISGIQKAEADGMFDPIPPLPDRAALSRL